MVWADLRYRGFGFERWRRGGCWVHYLYETKWIMIINTIFAFKAVSAYRRLHKLLNSLLLFSSHTYFETLNVLV